MMASENGLLAIRLGGQGDQTATAIRWRYQRPVPQGPSTLLYRGVLYMINDSGIMLSFDPATGHVSCADIRGPVTGRRAHALVGGRRRSPRLQRHD